MHIFGSRSLYLHIDPYFGSRLMIAIQTSGLFEIVWGRLHGSRRGRDGCGRPPRARPRRLQPSEAASGGPAPYAAPIAIAPPSASDIFLAEDLRQASWHCGKRAAIPFQILPSSSLETIMRKSSSRVLSFSNGQMRGWNLMSPILFYSSFDRSTR